MITLITNVAILLIIILYLWLLPKCIERWTTLIMAFNAMINQPKETDKIKKKSSYVHAKSLKS